MPLKIYVLFKLQKTDLCTKLLLNYCMCSSILITNDKQLTFAPGVKEQDKFSQTNSFSLIQDQLIDSNRGVWVRAHGQRDCAVGRRLCSGAPAWSGDEFTEAEFGFGLCFHWGYWTWNQTERHEWINTSTLKCDMHVLNPLHNVSNYI